MPNCFTLTRKGDTKPTSLGTVDRELCQRLDLPFNDFKYTCQWYDTIGFALALGRTLPELIDCYRDWNLNLHRIAAYLNEHYTVDAWAER